MQNKKIKLVFYNVSNFILLSFLNSSPAFAGDGVGSNTLPTAIQNALAILMWGAIGFFTVMGLIAVGTGFMKMWDQDDPRERKKGMKQMIWGGLLTFFMIVLLAIKLFVFGSASETGKTFIQNETLDQYNFGATSGSSSGGGGGFPW